MLEECLRRIEELLKLVLNRLDNLERLLRSNDVYSAEALKIAGELVLAFSIPAVKALEYSSRIVRILPRVDRTDEISKSIIKVLSTREEITISELTRRVKKLRGKASRRIVSERVYKLAQKGIVTIRRSGSRLYVRLADDFETE